MTDQQQRDQDTKDHYHGLITSYEKEIIELKHRNHALEERIESERTYSRWLLDGWETVVNERYVIITKTFMMGITLGVIITSAILSFFLS